jgi:glycosyltransferase involved in cell wall biosynthesis
VRVAFVFPHATTGGAEAYLAAVMDRLGPEWIAGVAVLRDGPFVAQLRSSGAAPLVVDTPARPLAILRSARELRRWDALRGADVVHANGLKAGLIAGLACLGRRPPVVWMKHDLAGSGLLSFVVALLSREVVAVSAAAGAGVPRPLRKRVRVVYDGLPDHRPEAATGRADACRLLDCDPDAEIVVHVGRLCPGKGQAETIAIAVDVLAERPAARFLLLGEEDPSYPGYRAELLSRIRSLELDRRVVLAGHRDDAVALIAGADLLVAPSVRDPAYGWSEGFGLAAAEAMWVGTPVVAYANGSLPEVLDGAGIVVPEGDRPALASAVAALLANDSRRAELAGAGTRLARSRYRIEDAVEALRSRYRALAAGTARSGSRPARRA